MSRIQTSYVDYANLGDTGANTAAAIQPLQPGEAASAPNLGRAAENVRSRTEIARDVVEDLLYYRDYGGRYVLDTTGSGTLAWEVGAAGRVHNDTTLTIRPFIGPRTNVKGVLRVGTATLTQVIYTVANTAYASDGMNRVTVEHRSVPGTSPVTVTISAGPVYNILVVFDASNGAHDAATVSGLVSSAIAGHSFLAGKIVVTTSATPGLAILATAGRVPLSTRVHAAGTTGNATADLEEHVLAAGALNTFTTTYPLVEGSVLAIRYDYNVEPAGSDPNDPKGGVPGGRSESNASRSSTDVSANLFRVHDYPEWIPGCIPLCKVVHGRLVWCDGTILASGTSGTPGSTYATHISPAAFSGLPTQVVNGGIDNGGDPVIQDTFVSVDERLSQSRYATWTTTDGTNSTGGHYNGVGAVTSAVAACTNGGTIVVRRGAYTTGLPAITITSGGLTLRGETHDNTLTSRTRITAAANTSVTSPVTLDNFAYLRTGSFVTDLIGSVSLSRMAIQAGALRIIAGAGRARVDDCSVLNTISTGGHGDGGLSISAQDIYVTNSRFLGTDPLAPAPAGALQQADGCLRALYENCEFRSSRANVQPFAFELGSSQTTFVNCVFTMTGHASAFALDLAGADLGGKVTFRGCRFVNDTGFAVARVTPISGHVTFDDCSFEGTGSPNGLTTQYQSVLSLSPTTASARVTVRNCSSRLTATNFTGITRPVYRLGSDESGGAAVGSVQVDGLDITIAGTTTTLSPSAIVNLQGTSRCHYARVDVDVSGKRAPDVTNSVPNYGPGYVFIGTGDATRLQLREFTVRNANAPLTTGLGTCVAGWFLLELCDLFGAQVLPTAAPSTNTFTSAVIHLLGATIRDATLYGFRQGGAANPIRLESAGTAQTRAIFENVTLHTAVPPNQAWGVSSVVTLAGGICRRLRISQGVSYEALTAVFEFAGAPAAASEIHDCDVAVVQSAGGAFVQANAGGATNCVVKNNRFRSNNNGGAAPGTVLFSGGHVGLQMTGNIFTTNGDVAANSTPDPTVVVATAATAISNNTFNIASSTPA